LYVALALILIYCKQKYITTKLIKHSLEPEFIINVGVFC
jgi:hypothetical protein